MVNGSFCRRSTNVGGDLFLTWRCFWRRAKRRTQIFEQGLPTPSTDNPVDTTAWGLVPLMQALVPAFDNDAESRVAQDVGYDGLSTEKEREFLKHI